MKKPTKVITLPCEMGLYDKITQLAEGGRRSRGQQIKLMLEEWLKSKNK